MCCKSFLDITDTSLLWDKMFSAGILWSTNVFNVDEVQCIYFLFCCIKHLSLCLTQEYKNMFLYSLTRILYFYLLYLGFWSIWVNTCVWHEIQVQLHCFAWDYSVVLAPFVDKNSSFPTKWFYHPCQNEFTINVRIYF